ncbi:MAG: gfo/Idh/MocA family oxidoreductase [Herbinix sp.]|jgi:predicted dehydrogenase|nr:gfo/Idh/MocA family oxidoreductase [Herbinix sp.]
MKTIKFGIIGAADIAYRRFLPALTNNGNCEYIGVASKSGKRVLQFKKDFGGIIYHSYEELLHDTNIDAVYIPLVPSLHYEWSKKAIEAGKHVFLEKPATINAYQTKNLVEYARLKGVAIYENFAFTLHNQILIIKQLLQNKAVGDIRKIYIKFGYPRRLEADFRYNRELGGGALLDCGVYTLKLTRFLLGENCEVTYSKLYYDEKSNVDLYGSATFQNNKSQIADVSFGIDMEYQCSLEIWGSNGIIRAPRIFTAPADYYVNLILIRNNVEKIIPAGISNQFYKAIEYFINCIEDQDKREICLSDMSDQSMLVEKLQKRVYQTKGM